jgi:Peptidase family M23
LDIYQPFYSFGPEIEASRMRFELLFMEHGHLAPPVAITADVTSFVDVQPRAYHPSGYRLPMHGLVLVHDGHDFYSHHRRYNLVKRFQGDPGSAVSATLYAYDLMKVKEDGALFAGDPRKKESWLTYGVPIFAPASGTVVEAVSDVAENIFAANGDAQIPSSADAKDPLGFGNHVAILHGDGRVSWLLHMQPGSVQVKAGSHVYSGQFLGIVGFSGDSLFPHLHFNVTDGTRYPSQGVPSYFRNFVRVVGSRKVGVLIGEIDTGDLIKDADTRAGEKTAASALTKVR